VFFFDEADAIASRRSSSVDHAQLREANLVVKYARCYASDAGWARFFVVLRSPP